MAFNQVAKYYQGYIQSLGTSQGIIAGLTGLSLKGSTSLAGSCADYSGNIYVTDPIKHIILKITESGNIINLAGLSGASGNNSDTTVTCANARFNYPTGIACDKNGDLYICDTNNNQIRKISNNKVSLVAGAANCASGTADGVGNAARFNKPYGIDIDPSGTIYIADTFNHAIRKIKGGVVLTIAGLRGTAGHVPVWNDMTTSYGVTGPTARFRAPYALSVSSTGYVFVSDTDNHVIKRIDPAGNVRIFSGTGAYGKTNGTAKVCTYQDLKYSDVTKSDELYVIDFNENGASRLMFVNREGAAYPIIDWAVASDGQYSASVVCNPAAHLIVIESDYTKFEYSSSSSSSTSSYSSNSSSSSNS